MLVVLRCANLQISEFELSTHTKKAKLACKEALKRGIVDARGVDVVPEVSLVLLLEPRRGLGE